MFPEPELPRRGGGYTVCFVQTSIIRGPFPFPNIFSKHLTTAVLPPCHDSRFVVAFVRLEGETSMPRAKKTATSPQTDDVTLHLDAKTLEGLDKLVPMVAESAAAREFGIEVDRRLVARVALLRGLTAMLGAAGADEVPESVAPPPALGLPGVPEPSESPSTASDPVDTAEMVEVGEDGFYDLPTGWNPWSTQERIPDEHREIHDYYAAGGWNRYWGRVNDEVIAFYWSPDPKLHAYPSYKKADRTGKEINVQKTPYGPGHIVPRGWMV